MTLIACIFTRLFRLKGLLLLLMLFTVCQLQAGLVKTVTISVKNTPLKKVLREIKRQTGYTVFYENDLLAKARLVSIDIHNVSLEDALRLIFEQQPFTYEIIGAYMIAVKERPAAYQSVHFAETIFQNKTGVLRIKGNVQDETGTPLSGAVIRVVGTTIQTVSTADGHFEIEAPAASSPILDISYVGYTNVRRPAGNGNMLSIVLPKTARSLDEIVIVGYGARKKSDVTGAISVINEKALHQIPAGNITTALQGTAPGLSVLKNGGNNHPAVAPVIRVRGNRSLGAGNNPLIILDGLPFNGNINDISQDDIVSAQLLKDASATAIYGSRGANGVVLLQTRRGKSTRSVITYNGYQGISRELGQYDVMDAGQLLLLRKWARVNGSQPGIYTGIDDPSLVSDDPARTVFSDKTEYQQYLAGNNTNWQRQLYKTALLSSHQLGVSGGNENTQHDVSFSYYNAGGIYPGQGMQRFTVKLSLDHKLSRRLQVGLNSLNAYNLTKGINLNPVAQFLQASPFSSPWQSDGTLATFLPGSSQNVWNPLQDFVPGNLVDDVKRLTTFTTGYLDVGITGNLRYRLNAGAELSPETQGKFYGVNTTKQLGNPNYGYNRNASGYAYTLENIISWDKTFAGRHRVNATALYSVQTNRTEVNDVTYRNVLADYIQYYNPQYASSVVSTGSFNKSSILSWMGRLNYSFADRYLFTVTMRADGSSRLAAGNKWHSFPSAAVAWNVANERFLKKVSALNSLKLRASYGETGNQAIDSYETIGGLAGINYNFGGTNVQGTFPDPQAPANVNLGWEYTTTLNLGVDIALYNNRITGSLEFYHQKTSDILLYQTLPRTSGYSRIRNNIGNTENKGIELNLSTVNVSGKAETSLIWNTDINIFFNRNRITRLASGATRDLVNNWFTGQPNGVIFDYKREGLWQNTPEDIALAATYGLVSGKEAYLTGPNALIGTVKPADVNNDKKITADDRVILGSRQPKLEGGITNRFTWRHFDLSVVLYFKYGGKLKSGIHGGWANTLQGHYNNLDVDYWTPGNTGARWPKPNYTLQNPAYKSTLDVFDASFCKVRTLSLGYSIENGLLNVIKAKSLRIYATASNPFIFFSPYKREAKGLDPETNYNIDEITPALWSMLLGVHVSF